MRLQPLALTPPKARLQVPLLQVPGRFSGPAAADSVRFASVAVTSATTVDPKNVKLTADATMLLTNAFKMTGPPPKEQSGVFNLMGLLLLDPSVQNYLTRVCKTKPKAVFDWVQYECLEKTLQAEQQDSKAPDVRLDRSTDGVKWRDSMFAFAASEGDTEVDPVTVWRWIMKTDPTGRMADFIKLSGMEASKQALLLSAPKPVDFSSQDAPKLTKAEIIELRKNLAEMKSKVVDQDDVLEEVANGILGAYDGLPMDDTNPNQPRGIFMFLGPSGVGKTYTAKLMAKATNRDIIVLKMSEYMEKSDAAKLKGASAGFIGYGDPCFVDKVIAALKKAKQEGRRAPIILMDEIEKADPVVMKTLMQVLDEGELESSAQDIAYFRDSLIVMTSNVAQRELVAIKKQWLAKEQTEENLTAMNEELEQTAETALKQKLDPEVYGRIHYSLVFNALTEAGARTILDQQLAELDKRAQKDYGAGLQVEPSLRDYIFKKGFSFDTGVRTIKNIIKRALRNLLVPFVQDMTVAEQPLTGGTIECHRVGKTTTFNFIPPPAPSDPPAVPAPAPPA